MAEDGEWALLLEDLLRGLVHAMNNRITALSAFAELAAQDSIAPELELLRHEIQRLYEVSALVGVLASRSDSVDALEVGTVLDAALEIHSHHPRIRTATCTVEKSGTILPVRVPRWALLRLFLLMVDLAKRTGADVNAKSVAIWLSGDDAEVRLHLTSRVPLGSDAEELAACCGGVLSHANAEAMLVLPSLLELRRRAKGTEGR